MSYQINGVDLLIPPSEVAWGARRQLGVDGYNRAIYEPTYSFQMSFDGLSQAEYSQLYAFWQSLASSTTVSVTIPKKDTATYEFVTYTGCVIDEPAVGPYHVEYQLSCKLIVRGIVV